MTRKIHRVNYPDTPQFIFLDLRALLLSMSYSAIISAMLFTIVMCICVKAGLPLRERSSKLSISSKRWTHSCVSGHEVSFLILGTFTMQRLLYGILNKKFHVKEFSQQRFKHVKITCRWHRLKNPCTFSCW